MKTRLRPFRWGAIVALVLCCMFGRAALAQETDTADTTEIDVQTIVQEALDNSTYDPDEWSVVANRAEAMVLRDVASVFALSRLRNEIVVWRDLFSAELDQNSQRLATLDAQLTALGEAPAEGETEAEAVADRRAELDEQRGVLEAPRLLANEAHARADGLISEIDRLVRARKTAEILIRTESPLWPSNWADALSDFGAGISGSGTEAVALVRRDVASGAIAQRLPLGVLYLGFAYFMILRARRWLSARAKRAETDGPLTVGDFANGLAQLIAPVLGLLAVFLFVSSLNVTGQVLQSVLDGLIEGALIVILGHWLAAQVFPIGPIGSPLGYSEGARAQARRACVALAWATGIWVLVVSLLDTVQTTSVSRAIILLPFVFVLSVLLFQLGRVVGRAPEDVTADGSPRLGRKRTLLGRLCKLVALAAPVLAVFGYSAATEAVLLPTVLTLGVIGGVLYLQRLVNDVYRIWAEARGRQSETLVPVLISFAFLVLSLPLLALIWGAQESELIELWTRFREGFAVGETRLSPTDFLTFVLIFAAGYLLTRLIQSTLRTSVLPRTRLDLGGQNAVVAGFGYVGIGLAAIIAITSAGIDLSNLAIVAGALSVGIGFGLQNIVSNFVSGIILLIERPVSEGDWIEVGGQMGYVRDISVRSTRIETFDRTDVIIPNADLVSGQVTNWTRGNLVGRVIVPVGVAYGTDVDRVKDILLEIAAAHPMVLLTPPPAVVFVGFGASSLDFEIRAILRDVNFVLSTKSEMNFEIAKRFAAEEIEIPFPQQDLWLRNLETLRPSDPKEET